MTMNKIYLDAAATTSVCAVARVAAMSAIENFGNPSSMHAMGLAAEKIVATSRESIAHVVNAKPNEIYFTASGTEANNLAVFGGAKSHIGAGIITSPTEHSSVKNTILALVQKGFKMFHVEHLADGSVRPDSLQSTLAQASPVSLISIHHIHNETGVIQDIAALGKIIKETSPATLFHVDAVQSFSKIPIDVRGMGVDLLSVSAHKIGGIKGCGALFVRENVHINPIILGGGQENGLRSGTENVSGIAAFGAAARDRYEKMQENYEYVNNLKRSFLDLIGNVDINGGNASPYILNISIANVRPEVLLNALSAEGVYISAGSACSANRRQKKDGNATLMAYGLPKERSETSMRISFSPENTMDEISIGAEIFVRCVENLRRTRRLR